MNIKTKEPHWFKYKEILMYRIVKRNNEIVDFDINKIKVAMSKAFEATKTPKDDSVLDMLTLRVCADFSGKVKDGLINVEDIQDSVEVVLIQAGFVSVAKAYILYRKNHESIRDIQATVINYKKTMDDYLKVNDWRVKENSTVTYSVGGLILNNSGALTANYWLSEVYDREIADAHRNADIHIHDLSMLINFV